VDSGVARMVRCALVGGYQRFGEPVPPSLGQREAMRFRNIVNHMQDNTSSQHNGSHRPFRPVYVVLSSGKYSTCCDAFAFTSSLRCNLSEESLTGLSVSVRLALLLR
jgi:hypothetical protein